MTAVIDGGTIQDRADLHDALSAALDLPAWYGRNLDALYDCLTDLPETEIQVLRPMALVEALGSYGEACLDTLRDAAQDNPNLRLIMEAAPSQD